MNVTTKITVDLTRQNVGQRVNAVQGDGNTRSAEITLLSGGQPWTPPEGVDVAIAYYQPDGHKGLYNLLADGTAAISISGNVASVILAPQMLTASGTVQASLVFNDQLLNRLTTFPFSVCVANNPSAGAQKVEDYLRLQWLEDKLDEYLRKAADSGEFDGAPGDPGLSPTVAVNDITGGRRITITDAEGDKTVDVMDGAQGIPGHTPEYGVDYGTPEQITGIAKQAAEILQPELSHIEDDLGKLKNATCYEREWTETIESNVTWEDGYILPNGIELGQGSYCHCSVSVQSGDVITLYRDSVGALIQTSRFVCCKKNGSINETKGSMTEVSFPYTVPDDVDEVIFSVSYAYYTYQSHVSVIRTNVELIPNITKANRIISQGSIRYQFNVSNENDFIGTDDFQNIVGYSIVFTGKISSIIGVTKIGHGLCENYGGGIGFDGTNLYQYMDTNANPVRTQAHGLTLKDYVSVIIDVPWSKAITVTICTNGGMYKWDVPFFRAYRGVFKVVSENTITDCQLSYTASSLSKPTWLYGDSYFIFTDNTRWTYYLIDTDHTEYMLNAYAGRASEEALQSLKYDLSLGCKPTRVVWCLGMNDKDNASSVNSVWKYCVDELIDICDTNGIELILATIPNTPSTNTFNSYKNEIVRNSGKRYIDFAKCVNGESDNASWYDGMLYSDEVHPDVQGAIALYAEAINCVPELLD